MSDLTKLTAEELLRTVFSPLADEAGTISMARVETLRRLERLEEIESTEQLAEDTYREMKKRLEECEAAISAAFDPRGCACIKDMPGDNYTCTAHQTLYTIAREIAARAALEGK